ncbi:MAG TPA: PaeR7I family type II restriction endonuclease [Phycisphaerae bacterium]|nr:PaeR7I family type II restriction endonuclease [Phycisphaerae bacterium]
MTDDLRAKVSRAVAHFWRTRDRQLKNQGSKTGQRDSGTRGAVTGGKQLDGFIKLVRELLTGAGLPDAAIRQKEATLPGYFRATKEWDLLVVTDGNLIATLEFKSQVGPSFGNNFNNRTEEAIGSATDLWMAHREGAFKDSIRPWLGYFMMLEDTKRSTSPVSVKEPHFPVFPEFKGSSYAKRYELFCLRLVRERLYDGACFLLSPREAGKRGQFIEPNDEISFARFASSLTGHAAGYAKLRKERGPVPVIGTMPVIEVA